MAVMSERGVAGATTRAITEKAGVQQSIFHYCYDSKAALLQALLERESDRAMEAAWQADPHSHSFEEALTSSISAQLRRVSQQPDHFRVLAELTVLARTDASLSSLARTDRNRVIQQMASVISRWRPDLAESENHEWAVVVVAGVDGLTEGWLTDPDSQDLAKAATRLAASIACGVNAHPAAP